MFTEFWISVEEKQALNFSGILKLNVIREK